MYSKMGPTASNSSHLPTKASFPESSSPPPSLYSPPLPSPPLLSHSLSNHLFELWGTGPQPLWLSPLCKYLTALVKQEACSRLACVSVCESNRVCMRELIAQSVPEVEADVWVEQDRICERASESPLLGGSAPAVRWKPTLWSTHGRGCRIQGLKVKQECMSVYTPPPILPWLDPCLSCSSGLNCIHSWDDRCPRYWYCLLIFAKCHAESRLLF